ncbi:MULTISPECIES: hypothetical protein [Streptomyces]|uniref:hypothetical protein n=1 Tax=Streptomyces TaxID=1883 RepID=UPI00200EC6C4|nr:hypothetical protein [Streptomyces sp. LRE541]UPZ29862.1 hypothetical protein MUK60_19890 [Streptomyces sp. LRE541]
MSLSVDVYVPRAEGGIEVLDVPPGRSDAAGPEQWRTEVWGSEPVRSLGARFLPRLATEDLTVAPDEMPAFLAECALIRTQLARLASTLVPADAVSRRLDNIVDAARRASDIGGGIIIW